MKRLLLHFLVGAAGLSGLSLIFEKSLCAAEEENSWRAPLWIHTLELPRELGEKPIFESSTFVLSGEQNEENLSLLIERRNNLVYITRLVERPNPGLVLNRWKENFLKNHKIRKDLQFGDLGVDIISRFEDHPLLPSLELYRKKFQIFWDNPDRLEIFSSELVLPRQVITESIQEGLPIVNKHSVVKMDAPNWELFIGLLFISHAIDVESETPITQYFEVPDHQLVALVGILDRKNPSYQLIAELSLDQNRFRLQPLNDEKLSKDLAQIFLLKDFEHGLNKLNLSKVSKLFKLEQIKTNNSLTKLKTPIDSRIHFYSMRKKEPALVREFLGSLEQLWASKHKAVSKEVGFSPSELLSLIQDFHIGSVRLDENSKSCRSFMGEISALSGDSNSIRNKK
ncbi:MAG: hypothetical protein ACO3LE_02210 [Bdellovibrionota bacterium]